MKTPSPTLNNLVETSSGYSKNLEIPAGCSGEIALSQFVRSEFQEFLN